MRKLQACSLGSGFGLVRNGSRSQTVRAGTRVIGSGASAAMSSSSAPVIPHDKLLVEQTKTPRPKPANDSLVFGKAFSDHMCRVSWESQSNEWSRPVCNFNYTATRHSVPLNAPNLFLVCCTSLHTLENEYPLVFFHKYDSPNSLLVSISR